MVKGQNRQTENSSDLQWIDYKNKRYAIDNQLRETETGNLQNTIQISLQGFDDLREINSQFQRIWTTIVHMSEGYVVRSST